jgi:hypothetical protein
MNKLCAITERNVHNLRILRSAENCQQRSTGAPQLFLNQKAMQRGGTKRNFELSRIWRGLIYYY